MHKAGICFVIAGFVILMLLRVVSHAGGPPTRYGAPPLDATLMGFKAQGVWYFQCIAPVYLQRIPPHYLTFAPPPPCRSAPITPLIPAPKVRKD